MFGVRFIQCSAFMLMLGITLVVPRAGCLSPAALGAQESSSAVRSPNEKSSAQQWTGRAERRGNQISASVVNDRSETLERFRIVSDGTAENILILREVTPSLLHEEYNASVRINATRPGIRVALRVAFPHQIDPRTRNVLTTLLEGDSYRREGEWQTLRIAETTRRMESRIRLIRTELHRSELDLRQPVVTGLVVVVEAAEGETFVDVGESRSGPDVAVPESIKVPQLIKPVASTNEVAQQFVPLKVELNQIVLGDAPVLLRFLPDHGEPIELMERLKLNSAWIPDCRETTRAQQLFSSGLAVLATPPHPEFEPGKEFRLLASLPPLDTVCPNASAWYMGTRIAPDQLNHFLAWSRETRSADRKLDRVQMADVIGLEGAVSREIDLVGIGRHVIGRSESIGELRNQLFRRHRTAGQLSAPWTWIQIEPSGFQRQWREAIGAPMPYVEPEQILLQVNAAMSAGYKGVGYWKTRKLDLADPLDEETALAVELSNLELMMIEPFLAKGRVDAHLRMQPPEPEVGKGSLMESLRNSKQPWLQQAFNSPRLTASIMETEQPDGPDAAVITANGSMLILVNMWDKSSQFVPSTLYAQELSLVVAASETASPYLISPTGIRGLPREVRAGGLRVTLKNFDRSALVVVSSDMKLLRSMEERIHLISERAAEILTRLSSLKYRRVLQVVEELREYNGAPPEADRLFALAQESNDRAQEELRQRDYPETAEYARKSLQYLRQVQSLSWLAALKGTEHPATYPHLISFSTLPAHWDMRQRLEASRTHESINQLPTGSFENLNELSTSGWRCDEASGSGYSCSADIVTEGPQRNSVLRLTAWLPNIQQGSSLARSFDITPVVVTSTPVTVVPGELVRISGRFRRGRAIASQAAFPLLIFDSELGPEAGLRLKLESDWKPFELIREIAPGSNSLSISAALTGMGEVQIDDLSITRVTVAPEVGPAAPLSLTGQTKTAPQK